MKSTMQLRIGITAVTLELSRLRYLATKSFFFPLLLLLFFFRSFRFLTKLGRLRPIYLSSRFFMFDGELIATNVSLRGSILWFTSSLNAMFIYTTGTNRYFFVEEETRDEERESRFLARFLESLPLPFQTSLSGPLLVQRIYSADYFAFLGPPLIVLSDKRGEGKREEGQRGKWMGKGKKERKKEQSQRRCTTSSAISAYLCR